MTPHQTLIGTCLVDPACIDKAVAAGASALHFDGQLIGIWNALVEIRAAGRPVDVSSLALHMGKACPMAAVFECEAAAPTSALFETALEQVLWARSAALMKAAAKTMVDQLDAGCRRSDVAPLVDSIASGLTDQATAGARPTAEIVSEVEQWADDLDAGKVPEFGATLGWLDSTMTPIGKHELVVIGARPSQGKSSIACQVIGDNIALGKRVAHFALETSDASVVKQVAAQRARVNLRDYGREFEENKNKFRSCLNKLRTGNHLRVFDRVLNISAIEAQCRLLKASWRPDLVVLDYLQIVQAGIPGKLYEQVTHISNRLVELRKAMECPVIVCAQLNRVSENENRAPRNSDLRDSGAIEAAAHRIILLYRPTEDFEGLPQSGEEVGQRTHYHYYLMQTKLRDGPVASVRAKFNSLHTVFGTV